MSAPPFSVVILAGGHGRRLGEEKAAAIIAGRPLLWWTAEAVAPLTDDLLIARRAAQTLPEPPAGIAWRALPDRRDDAGPLAGIESALREARHEVVVAVACDMPLVRGALVQTLAAACAEVDLVMPLVDDVLQPLLAAYHRRCLPVVTAQLDAGERRIRALLPLLRDGTLDPAAIAELDPALESFANVNTPADRDRVAKQLRARRA